MRLEHMAAACGMVTFVGSMAAVAVFTLLTTAGIWAYLNCLWHAMAGDWQMAAQRALTRKTAATHDFLETSLVAVRIPFRIDGGEHEVNVSGVIGAIE